MERWAAHWSGVATDSPPFLLISAPLSIRNLHRAYWLLIAAHYEAQVSNVGPGMDERSVSYMEGRDAFVISVSSIILRRLKELLHACYVPRPERAAWCQAGQETHRFPEGCPSPCLARWASGSRRCPSQRAAQERQQKRCSAMRFGGTWAFRVAASPCSYSIRLDYRVRDARGAQGWSYRWLPMSMSLRAWHALLSLVDSIRYLANVKKNWTFECTQKGYKQPTSAEEVCEMLRWWADELMSRLGDAVERNEYNDSEKIEWQRRKQNEAWAKSQGHRMSLVLRIRNKELQTRADIAAIGAYCYVC